MLYSNFVTLHSTAKKRSNSVGAASATATFYGTILVRTHNGGLRQIVDSSSSSSCSSSSNVGDQEEEDEDIEVNTMWKRK